MCKMLLFERSYLIVASITFPAQIANNLIEYELHAERFISFKKNPRLFPVGGFCVHKLHVVAVFLRSNLMFEN